MNKAQAQALLAGTVTTAEQRYALRAIIAQDQEADDLERGPVTRKEAQALLDGITPGRWRVGKQRKIYAEGQPLPVGQALAQEREWKEATANARAIASLPDLLKAFIAQSEDNERLTDLLREADEVAWPEAVILVTHPDPERAAKAKSAFYEWREKTRATLKESDRHD